MIDFILITEWLDSFLFNTFQALAPVQRGRRLKKVGINIFLLYASSLYLFL